MSQTRKYRCLNCRKVFKHGDSYERGEWRVSPCPSCGHEYARYVEKIKV